MELRCAACVNGFRYCEDESERSCFDFDRHRGREAFGREMKLGIMSDEIRLYNDCIASERVCSAA
jgi:hypothetical protein